MKRIISMLISGIVATLTNAASAQDGAAQQPQQQQRQPPAIDLFLQPTLYLVAYAHLDTQWRWCYPITIREYLKNTLHDNFALIEKYPNYVFNFSGSRRYQMMKEYYPTEYQKLKEYVAAGRWFPCGSSVDECDANVPSAESLVRHVLYGNRFFRREFGVASEEFMLPDCFGFPAALPSVLAHCGIKGFSTQKLTWGSAVPIPFKVGVWEGPDGASVTAALDPGAYVGEVRGDLSTNDSWRMRVQNNGELSGVFTDYHYYGTGDMGGAPTEKSVQMVEKSVAGGDGSPLKVISGPADWMFKTITPEMREALPRYSGELLLTEHSAGSITSQSYMKRWNRKNELLADATEKAAVIAWWLGAKYPSKRLEDAWTLALGSQMHDILPGTSHPKAYEYSWNDEVLAANQFAAVLTDAVGAVSSVMDTRAQGTPLVIFNPLSIEREDVIEIDLPWSGAAPPGMRVSGPDGRNVPAQVLSAQDGKLRLAVLARAPSLGFSLLDVRPSSEVKNSESELSVTDRSLENHRYLVTVDDQGDVASIFDKKAKREMLAAPSRLALLYEKPKQWPAWNMDWTDRQQPPRSYVSGPATIRVVENGPVRIALHVERQAEGSTFIQTIRLSAGEAGDRVEFDTTIDWMTRERSLKAVFPLTVSNPNATYDIQVGTIQRDNNNAKRYENPSHQWFDLTDAKGDFGVTVMNDSKYGSDKPDDSTLRLTLLYTPGVGGDYQDQGTQDFGRHQILYALAGHQSDWRAAGRAASPWIAARLNQPLHAFVVPAHEGALGRSFSFAAVSEPSAMISAMKKADDGNYLVIRLRELVGAVTKDAHIKLAFPVSEAVEIDGQERRIGPGKVVEGELATDGRGRGLRAFGIKVAPPPTKIVRPESVSVELPFDADVVSHNSKRDDGTLWNTFPAEQLGPSIPCGNSIFKLGGMADGQNNAALCRGQSIPLPAGEFDRLELLAASAEQDQQVAFEIDGAKTNAVIPAMRGYIGQWDNRAWLGEIPEVAFNWPAKYGGLSPGFVKPQQVAWYCSHHHAPDGDQHYQYCYLFKIDLNLPRGAKMLTLPSNQDVMVLAANAVKTHFSQATPASRLFDALTDRGLESPRIDPSEGTFDDVTRVRIEPRFYGRADAIRFTIDDTQPTPDSRKYDGPITVDRSTTIRAAMIGADGSIGSEARAQINVDDRKPPRVLKAFVAFEQPVIHIHCSESLDEYSVSLGAKYVIEPDMRVRGAEIGESPDRIILSLDAPLKPGKTYSLIIRNLKDDSPSHNVLAETVLPIAAPIPLLHMGQLAPEIWGRPLPVPALPVKGQAPWTLNMFVRADKEPENRTVIAGFGARVGKNPGDGRYLCKFANGIHFWSHNSDLQGNAPFDLGRWQMITATYDGAVLRLYKDAALLNQREAQLADDEAVLHIAPLDPWENKRRFEGRIRDLTIWNEALDEQAIRSLQAGSQ